MQYTMFNYATRWLLTTITTSRWARPWTFIYRYQIGWTVLMLICW